MLIHPPWVVFGGTEHRQIRFFWDDARVDADFTNDATDLLDAVAMMSTRAQIVVLVGLYEWIVWRFDGLHRRGEPAQILEAAWCATVDPRYLAFFELSREEWIGPIEGPLWTAFTYLQHGLTQPQAFPADLSDALEFLYQLAMHVVPAAQLFEQWLGHILQRFTRQYPPQPEDPFDDLFEHRVGEHLGTLIGRDALDPTVTVDPARDRDFLIQLFAQARAGKNPFLATTEDLEDLGFEGSPYLLPP